MIVQYREDVGILISCTCSKPYTAFLAHRMVGRDDVTFSGSFDARGSAPAISTEPFTAVLRIQLTHATKTRSTRPRSTADFLLTAQQRPTRAAGPVYSIIAATSLCSTVHYFSLICAYLWNILSNL
jgi:hypothetical protein